MYNISPNCVALKCILFYLIVKSIYIAFKSIHEPTILHLHGYMFAYMQYWKKIVPQLSWLNKSTFSRAIHTSRDVTRKVMDSNLSTGIRVTRL